MSGKKHLRGALINLLVWATIANAYSIVSAEPAAVRSRTTDSKTPLLTGGINQLLVLCQSSGLTLSATKLPAKVLRVKLGSTAAFSGIRKGDLILQADVDKNVLTVTIQRGGSKFLATMATDTSSLLAMNPKTAPVNTMLSNSINRRGLSKDISEQQAEQVLSVYSFIIVADRSGSMSGPVEDRNAISKIAWMKSHISEFAEFLLTKTTGRTTLISFNSNYNIQKVAPRSLAHAMENLQASGGTNLAAPLDEAMKIAFSDAKPTIILVMSDGMHNLGPSLEDTIIAATRTIPPGQVVISFLQIGTDSGGLQVIDGLDEHLVQGGAKYDMVDARYFDELNTYGLKRILADAVVKSKSPR